MKNRRNGYTMTELVVTVALIGTLLSFAVPRYASISEETQGDRNLANMHVIREAFFGYFFRMHIKDGRIAHFPPQPLNADTLMDETWSNTPIDPTISGDKPETYFLLVYYHLIQTINLLNIKLGKTQYRQPERLKII